MPSNALCDQCEKIDFENILKAHFDATETKVVVKNLGSLEQCSLTCTLCQIFARVLTEPQYYEPITSWDLIAFSANSGSNLDQEKFRDNVLLSVVPEGQGFPPRGHNSLSWSMFGSTRFLNEALGLRLVPGSMDLQRLKSWVEFCTAHHSGLCSKKSPNLVPGLRFIDCHTRKVVPIAHGTVNTEYTTLSYLWGKSTEDIPPLGSLPLSVPLVIEDALLVTKALGFQYIWIDRYCIRQDNVDEKHELIQSMGTIYANSALTIIAAAGEGPNHGLPGISKRQRAMQHTVTVGNHTIVSSLPSIHDTINGSKWDSRGWTYQEGRLSRRRLVFTEHQVYFQCQNIACLESIVFPVEEPYAHIGHDEATGVKVFPLGDTVHYYSPGRPPKSLGDRILEYMQRNLSTEKDALKAFRGILEVFRSLEFPIYDFCGVPVYPVEAYNLGASPWARIAHSLTWSIDTGRSPDWKCPLQRRPEFPSWTWCGWKALLGYPKIWWMSDVNSKFTRGYVASGYTKCLVKMEIELSAEEHGRSFTSLDNKVDPISNLSEYRHVPDLYLTGWIFPVRGIWRPFLIPTGPDILRRTHMLGMKAEMFIQGELGREDTFFGCPVFMSSRDEAIASQSYPSCHILVLKEAGPDEYERVGLLRGIDIQPTQFDGVDQIPSWPEGVQKRFKLI